MNLQFIVSTNFSQHSSSYFNIFLGKERVKSYSKITHARDFPGGPVIKTSPFTAGVQV